MTETDIGAFQTLATSPLHITQSKVNKIKEDVWEQEFKEWTIAEVHLLQSQYSYSITCQHTCTWTRQKQQVRLLYDQKRMSFKDIILATCRQGGKADTTAKHVLEVCDALAVVAARHKAHGKIVKLCDKN